MFSSPCQPAGRGWGGWGITVNAATVFMFAVSEPTSPPKFTECSHHPFLSIGIITNPLFWILVGQIAYTNPGILGGEKSRILISDRIICHCHIYLTNAQTQIIHASFSTLAQQFS